MFFAVSLSRGHLDRRAAKDNGPRPPKVRMIRRCGLTVAVSLGSVAAYEDDAWRQKAQWPFGFVVAL